MFALIWKYGLKLNPTKCAFGIKSGKFLGYVVMERRIKVNPEKVQATWQMQSSQNVWEV